ncbi:hypothetical protein NX059_009343 [Plenodomus lindquistii]|nr:hypothetical protein NX059_009343 [Plenodomus lindquistii]
MCVSMIRVSQHRIGVALHSRPVPKRRASSRQQWYSLRPSALCLQDKHKSPVRPKYCNSTPLSQTVQLSWFNMSSPKVLPHGFQEDLQRAHALRNPTPPPKDAISPKYILPDNFLKGPAPDIKRSDINFVKANLPEYAGAWAVVLDGVMTEEECNQLVAAAEATTGGKWERAMVNVGRGMQAMYEDTRKCGRIIWDNREVMAKLWARIEGSVPEIHQLKNWADVTGNGPYKRNETWEVTRLNERGRYLKYTGGEYFKGKDKLESWYQLLNKQRTAMDATRPPIAPNGRTSRFTCISTTPWLRTERSC